jgi:hypothetical protein
MVSEAVSREAERTERMIRFYCSRNHGPELCDDCRALLEYSVGRMTSCTNGAAKVPCTRCPADCYDPAMRSALRKVSSYCRFRMIR